MFHLEPSNCEILAGCYLYALVGSGTTTFASSLAFGTSLAYLSLGALDAPLEEEVGPPRLK
jgi:hypothetical protein